MSDDYAEYLRRTYIDPPSSLGQSVILAEAEQLAQAVQDTRTACDAYNSAHELDWLTVDLPQPLRDLIGRHQARLREAQSRESHGGGKYVYYNDDRNGHDVAQGWPEFDPDNPHMQNVPFGHILSDPNTVHVLRGGTTPLFDRRDGIGRHQMPAEPDAELADYGPAYDFATFFRTAERGRMLHFCELHLPDGCGTGIGGGTAQLAAIPFGRDVWMVQLCDSCVDTLLQRFVAEHPYWRRPNPMTEGLV